MIVRLMPLAFLAVVLPLMLVGCTSPDPQRAFAGVEQDVSARTGHTVQWWRDDLENGEIDKGVDALLQSNLTAQSAVAIALLNNRTLQADFEELGIS